jgi:hypothetical protein
MRHTEDYTVIEHVQRLVGTPRVRPRDVRLAGVAFILGAVGASALELTSLWENRWHPKIWGLIPLLVSMGLWWIVDASALAEGRRAHQRELIGACVVLGIVVGVAALVFMG